MVRPRLDRAILTGKAPVSTTDGWEPRALRAEARAEQLAAQLADARAEVSAERSAVARLIHRAECAEALLQQARKGMQEACDLPAERTYGNPARSPGHNARLVLEASLQAPCLGTRELGPRIAAIVTDEVQRQFYKQERAQAATVAAHATSRILAILSVQPVPDGHGHPIDDLGFAQAILQPLVCRLQCRADAGENLHIGQSLRRELEYALAGAADRLSAPGKTQDGEALPIELAGPWHPDETGTFNSAGWGFTVLVPDRFWDRPDNELPPEVTAIAEALERSVRKHLNTASPGEKPGPDSQTSGGG